MLYEKYVHTRYLKKLYCKHKTFSLYCKKTTKCRERIDSKKDHSIHPVIESNPLENALVLFTYFFTLPSISGTLP
jgi:hypothetical protein